MLHLAALDCSHHTQGGVIAHAGKKVPSIPHYSTISRRINRLEIEINEKLGDDIVIALDNTGIKVANRGEWIRHKWHVRKGYLKIHVAVDIKNIAGSRTLNLHLPMSYDGSCIVMTDLSWHIDGISNFNCLGIAIFFLPRHT
jgi:hypothetical protein